MATQSKGTDHILVHSPLNEGFDRNGPSVPHYSNFFPQRHYPRNTRLQRMYPGRIPKNSFFARNNPHPGRVTHIKGLLDVPICCVQDGIFDGHRFVLSEPEIDPKLHETRLGPPRATRYSANKDKQIPAVGIVPVTFAWRDELERLTKQVVANAAMGNPPGKRSGIQTRQSSRRQSRNGKRQQNESIFSGLDETMLLELLCRILRTDSIPAIQAWLSSAPDAEKDIVLNMLGMAASGELAYSPSPRDVSQRPASRPSSQQVPHQSQWEPSASQAMHESEPIVEEDEALDRCVSRKSALERTIEMFGGRSLRSQSGNRPDTTSVDAPTETDPPQVEAQRLPSAGFKKSPVSQVATAPSRGPSRAATAGSGIERVTRSQSGSRKSRFKYVSTWTGANEPLPEES